MASAQCLRGTGTLILDGKRQEGVRYEITVTCDDDGQFSGKGALWGMPALDAINARYERLLILDESRRAVITTEHYCPKDKRVDFTCPTYDLVVDPKP